MKNALVVFLGSLAVMVLLILAPTDEHIAAPGAERPTMNLPKSLRQINWLGPHGEGSCAWASLVMDLNWEGEYEKAQLIRTRHGDGVNHRLLSQGMTAEGIPFVWTSGKNDVAFLEAALESRRGVMVAVDWGDPNDNEQHMVLLAHLDATSACIIDNNHPSEDRWMTREEFLTEWSDTGSYAVVPLFSAVPPLAN